MNEWMFNDTPAQNENRLMGVKVIFMLFFVFVLFYWGFFVKKIVFCFGGGGGISFKY